MSRIEEEVTLSKAEADMAIEFARGVTGLEKLSIDHYTLDCDLTDDDGFECTSTNVAVYSEELQCICCNVPMCLYLDAKERSCVLNYYDGYEDAVIELGL